MFERSFSKKDLGESAYILSIKIYRDRARRLISFFNEYIPWQDFESSSKWNSQRKSSCLCCKGMKLSKTQIPTMAENRKRMKSHSLCLSHRFYKVCYAMYQTYCIPCSGLAREYNSDLIVDHWTAVKIILSGIRKYFSIMEVTKSSS